MTDRTYFSDREVGPRPRIREDIPANVWGGIVTIIQKRIVDSSFGHEFPEECPDREGICGCDGEAFSLRLGAEIPDINWPLKLAEIPSKFVVLDLLEFCYKIVATPKPNQYHSFFRHYHYSFDILEGRNSFREEINNIFARNGIVFELTLTGEIIRLSPMVLREALTSTVFRTGDAELDSLLEAARQKYVNPDISIRKESLEKLWDAWERLKTIEGQNDKKASITSLITKAAKEPTFREALDKEANEVTRIGNKFMIRHHSCPN